MMNVAVYAKRQNAKLRHVLEISVYESLKKSETQTQGFKNFSSIVPNPGSITCHDLFQYFFQIQV
jgi:hypothetical protein